MAEDVLMAGDGSTDAVAGAADLVMEPGTEDMRNLQDEYKGLSNEEVFAVLDEKRNALEVAIENVEHDFNAGTIVRSANNFNVAKVHIIGRRKYNRRGAMCTEIGRASCRERVYVLV